MEAKFAKTRQEDQSLLTQTSECSEEDFQEYQHFEEVKTRSLRDFVTTVFIFAMTVSSILIALYLSFFHKRPCTNVSPKIPKYAVCHSAIFGSVDLNQHIQWAFYYRGLGFTHIYMWFIGVEENPGFDVLYNLDFMTLYNYSNYFQDVLEYRHQKDIFMECMRILRRENYTAGIFIDADEFLWIDGYTNIHDWAQKYRKYHAVSFTKWMYTRKYQYNSTRKDYGFNLSQYPYTPKIYCHENPGWTKCKLWHARAKLMIRPYCYDKPFRFLHGSYAEKHGSFHAVDTSEAHLKEWCTRNNADSVKDVVYLNNVSSFRTDNLDVHGFPASYVRNNDINGSVTVYFDFNLHPWLEKIRQNIIDYR